MLAVILGAAAIVAASVVVVGVLFLVGYCLDQRDDIGLLSAVVAGCRQREAAAVRRAERAEQRRDAAEAQLAALSTFEEHPRALPIRRGA